MLFSGLKKAPFSPEPLAISAEIWYTVRRGAGHPVVWGSARYTSLCRAVICQNDSLPRWFYYIWNFWKCQLDFWKMLKNSMPIIRIRYKLECSIMVGPFVIRSKSSIYSSIWTKKWFQNWNGCSIIIGALWMGLNTPFPKSLNAICPPMLFAKWFCFSFFFPKLFSVSWDCMTPSNIWAKYGLRVSVQDR